MKLAAAFVILAITGCAGALDPDTSTADQAAAVKTDLPSTSTTCQWSVDTTCYGQRNDGNNLWPTGIGITDAYVMTRRGPTRLSGRQPTFLAFVVWNDSVVGRIFRVDVGSSNAANFNSVLANTFAARTFSIPDGSEAAAGAVAGGPTPAPGPNVEPPIVFESSYLGAVVKSAATIHGATSEFLATKSSAID
ncbi:MAG TPA: hypothetical protein VHT91_19855 [Kofleriaceae bacterium]|jgi:hypothetical protein|nr:hypothetical protein [Kofleriaceae bacterium]